MNHNFFRVGSGLVILVTAMVIFILGFLTKTSKNLVKSPGNGFAVVELFTSEGCSSCPRADAEVEKLSVLHPDDVYVLGFHVDYWNRLGWSDGFSSAAYSERQREYGDHFKLNGIYTPQVVVNGRTEMVGSDATRLARTVDAEIKNSDSRRIELSAIASTGNTVNVTYRLMQDPASTTVNIALVQIAAETHVMKGENQGKNLHHINIVRDFKTVSIPGQAGSATLALPNGITAKECKVIVFLQLLKTREIIAAAQCDLVKE